MSDVSISKVLIDTAREVIGRKPGKVVWKNSKHEEVRSLGNDHSGQVGEEFIVKLLRHLGNEVNHTNSTDPRHKGWDMICTSASLDRAKLEVKTATLGKDGRMFQHENLEKHRNYEGIILLDITPEEIYITISTRDKAPWGDMHRRKSSNYYKWDISLKRIKDKEFNSFEIGNLEDFRNCYETLERAILAERERRKPAEEI